MSDLSGDSKISLSKIESTSRGTWRLAWSSLYKKWSVIVIIVAIISIGVIFYLISSHGFATELFWIPGIVVILYYSYLHHKVREQFMRQFAKDGGYEYVGKLPVKEFKGQLFEVGRRKNARYAVKGNYNNYPVRLFNYSYTVGSGKHSHTYSFTIFEVAFENMQFPHIVLQARSMNKKWRSVSHAEEVTLEQEFSDSFKLFAADGYELEAMQIFEPEMMHFLKERSSDFSVEFAEGRLYIYDDRVVSKREELDEMHAVVREILDRRGAFIKRLADDFESLEPYYKR